jgi:hypothetical protein
LPGASESAMIEKVVPAGIYPAWLRPKFSQRPAAQDA